MIILIDVSLVSIIFIDLMSLISSFVSRKIYNDAKLLIEELNKHAESESYAVITARFKKFKKDVDWIVYIWCNHEKKASLNLANFERHLHSDTRLMKCSFSVIDKQNKNDDWYLEVIWNKSHNHTSTLVSAHSALQRLVMTEKIQELISSLIKFEIRSTQILTHFQLDVNQENSFFTRHDVYNVKNQQRKQALDVLSSVQTLFQNLKHKFWFWQYEKNELDKIIKLFFSQSSCRDMLTCNSEILIMNCIYKINCYKMSLLIIIEVIALNIFFFVEFCFMTVEKTVNYVWVLKQLKLLYTEFDLSDSTMILTDCERDLINALQSVFRESSHLLCNWHIDKNVLVNCNDIWSCMLRSRRSINFNESIFRKFTT